jgi:pimeloyl-ACP methyl ester carboxylesterase
MAQNEERSKRPLTMPVLGIGGAASHADEVANAMKGLADDVQNAVIPGAGHWFAEEAPEETVAALTAFLTPYRDSAAAGQSPSA